MPTTPPDRESRLPRFSLDCTLELTDHVRAAVPALFDDLALARLTDNTPLDGTQTRLVQRVAVDVDEQGTVVAAATALLCCSFSAPAPHFVVRADRPFAFVVKSPTHGIVAACLVRQPARA